MGSRARPTPSKPKRIQKQLFERHVTEDQMERILRESQIDFREREKPELPEAKLKGRFTFVGDTDWGNVDPIQTIASTATLKEEDLQDEIIHSCGLFNATMMPFAVPLPDSCYEVAKRCKLDKRVLLDTEGNVIMDFTPAGIEAAFGWRRYGDDYTLAQSEEFRDSTARPGDYIGCWLYEDYQGIQGQRLVSARRASPQCLN